MNLNDILKFAGVLFVGIVIGWFLVGDNQSGMGGTRFPSGLSADGTSPSAGEVRGTTLTSTGAATLASGVVTAGLTVGTTLAVTGASTLSGATSYLESSQTHTVDDTLTVAESAKVNYIGTAGVDLTLPDAGVATGTAYKIVVSANVATTNMTVTGAAADATDDDIYGSVTVAGVVLLCSAEDTITFVADTNEAIEGDWIELRSDGTNWYISGMVSTASAFTCSDAD